MKKDFQKWHTKKESINGIAQRPFFHQREIWFCYLGANVGFEQDGQGEDFLRPIVIVRKFNNEVFWAVPLTKSNKQHKDTAEAYYYAFSFVPGLPSVAILSQIRLIDARRLGRLIGIMTEADFENLKQKLKALLP